MISRFSILFIFLYSRTPKSISRKLSGMTAIYIDLHCPSTEEYFSICLLSAAGLFTCLSLIVAKSSIAFGSVERQPQAWWSSEVEEVVRERHKAFAFTQKK